MDRVIFKVRCRIFPSGEGWPKAGVWLFRESSEQQHTPRFAHPTKEGKQPTTPPFVSRLLS